jgi:hypothetical protein
VEANKLSRVVLRNAGDILRFLFAHLKICKPKIRPAFCWGTSAGDISISLIPVIRVIRGYSSVSASSFANCSFQSAAIVWLPRPDRFKTPGTNVNIATKGDVFVLTEEQRRELQIETRKQIESHPTDPQEWDKYLEEHSFNPRRQRALPVNANDLEGETQEFRCEKCFKLFPRTQLGLDGKTCQQCADAT